jgi:flavodoxin
MKTLITFYSRTGSTKTVANELRKLLKADIDEIIDRKDRSGILGYIGAVRDMLLKKPAEIAYKKSPKDYDLVVIGTPVWATTMTPAVKTYLAANCRDFKNVSFFSTQGGDPPQKVMQNMEALCQKKPKAVLQLVGKKVKTGEFEEQLKEFAKKLD